MTAKPIVGIDVSKHWLDACLSGQAGVERVDNTAAAVAAWLRRVDPALVAFEPTGGYERVLCAALRERGVRHVRVHPNDLLAFRQSRAAKAKTDRIDARLIAAFAAEELPRRGLRPSAAAAETLRELAARRRQLVDALHAERCRQALAASEGVRASLAAVAQALQQSLEAIEAELERHVAAKPGLAALSATLQSLPGVGPVTATRWMLATSARMTGRVPPRASVRLDRTTGVQARRRQFKMLRRIGSSPLHHATGQLGHGIEGRPPPHLPQMRAHPVSGGTPPLLEQGIDQRPRRAALGDEPQSLRETLVLYLVEADGPVAPSGRGALRGRPAWMPRRCAAQGSIQGHRAQAGAAGVQIVAPRSNSAWAKSLGRARACGSAPSAAAASAMAPLAAGSGCSMAKRRAATRSTLPSTGTPGTPKAMAAMAVAV